MRLSVASRCIVMVDYNSIRTQLTNRLFTPYAKTVILKSAGTPSENDRGEPIAGSYTESSISLIDYNITNQSKTREQFGNFLAGDRLAAVPYNVSVNVDDIIVIRSVDYRVVEVRQPELVDVVVNLVQLRKVENGDY